MSKEETYTLLNYSDLESNTITFNMTDTTEIIKLCKNGDIFLACCD